MLSPFNITRPNGEKKNIFKSYLTSSELYFSEKQNSPQSFTLTQGLPVLGLHVDLLCIIQNQIHVLIESLET